MLTQYEKCCADDALRRMKDPGTAAAVVGIVQDNGQITLHNLGDKEGVRVLYQQMAITKWEEEEC